ncbi:MAG TPA: glycerol-3-phosphate 1-O-acyltransferase PlsY [Verrucomicrobiae bacterium]|nr:glycerol-3-phosphate 1-O-acyltransferase PlsY [Verrucomicrobiae bacterium]
MLGYAFDVVLSYLLGSIPTGYLVAKARNVDIRKVGSGNIGATNVFRILGKPAGIFVLSADAAKGLLAVCVVGRLLTVHVFKVQDPRAVELLAICAGIAAVLGHNYTCWLGFKGGKGIATSAGVLIGLVPWALVIILSIWILIFAFTRYVSLGSICAAFALPFAAWATGESPLMIGITGILGALAIYKHSANIKRLLNGTENRIGGRKREPVPPPPQSS